MSRRIEREVFVDAPPDVVWRALTEAGELTRWFAVDARVRPGVGGSLWLSWGEGMEGETPITAWEPGRRFESTQERGPVRLAVDFHIEATGGGTVVRLVHSGFGDAADWDDEFHMTAGGWSYFLAHLRWYLERHRGVPRDLIALREPTQYSREEALRRLLGPRGLSREDSLHSTVTGNAFRCSTALGDALSGVVLAASPETGQFGLTLSELGDAVLFLEMEPAPGGVRAAFWLSTYGLDADRLAEARDRYARLYAEALLADGR